MTSDLEDDTPEARETAARLHALIAGEIDAAGGWIPFSRFMDLALYAPGLGYYSAGAIKVGRHPASGSDFVTAPELTPLFARAIARPVADVLADGGAQILELGGGSGRLAADLLLELERLDALPYRYLLLEVSADFRERQATTLARLVPHLVERVGWLEALPERIDGIVLGNEVLDALPVELVVLADGRWLTRGVARVDGTFRFEDRTATAAVTALVEAEIGSRVALPEGYLTEVHPAATGLIGELVARMGDRSIMLMIDYGFPASEYYHPQRMSGTLMAHRRHRSSVEVLARPGLQDVTSHVNFSAIAQAATDGGGAVIGYTSQAAFLIDCGIAGMLSGDASDAAGWAPQAAALQTLLSEAEMGELFKVVAVAKQARALTGFGRSDRRPSL